MKVKIKCEGLGPVQNTAKGFIRQFLTVDPSGEKCVIKVFSKNSNDLNQDGLHERLVETDNFCFAPKA